MIVDAIRGFFAENDIHGPIVAAVSGGVDSTALLVALVEVDIEFSVAHINHHLRGAESDDDEAYVRELCARYDVALRVADGTLEPAAVRDRGIEAAAREVRHARLREIAGDALIATAHQKNDQAETVVMRLMTGGGIAALRGIHPLREDGVIRPLLNVTRIEIEEFLKQRKITPRFDRSNADPRFLRNRIRATLREFDPGIIDNLAAVADHARQQWPWLERAIDASEEVVTTDDETRFRSMPDDPWIRQALLLRHIRRLDPEARDVSASDLERLAVASERTSVTKSLELLKDGDEIILRRRKKETLPFEFEIDAGSEVYIPEIETTIRIDRANYESGNQRIQLPKGSKPHFTVRNRRDGDRFRPLGMAHDKKLKDLLIDRKIAATSRDRIPLLLWNDTIVWVAGVEVSELFKVTGETADLYEVAIEQTHQQTYEGVRRSRD
ncbi:MAG: tRNA lysidine(34) synthetase TilS [Acidobacteria bacterium]|nr:tRNA lysidine(34) synthetase TilS [Acidobacteriota bacterium]MBV9071511.1 tRNA lysidine(34) synthetase TilS [Acidobacteriota bacterium]MBV9184088.1 tRNA lysidine(34) synthetase TilS [Acidobacteriota bacterium]